jgi:hypothetical protein
MWDTILRIFKETLEKAELAYMTKAKSMWNPSLYCSRTHAFRENQVSTVLRKKIRRPYQH